MLVQLCNAGRGEGIKGMSFLCYLMSPLKTTVGPWVCFLATGVVFILDFHRKEKQKVLLSNYVKDNTS